MTTSIQMFTPRSHITPSQAEAFVHIVRILTATPHLVQERFTLIKPLETEFPYAITEVDFLFLCAHAYTYPIAHIRDSAPYVLYAMASITKCPYCSSRIFLKPTLKRTKSFHHEQRTFLRHTLTWVTSTVRHVSDFFDLLADQKLADLSEFEAHRAHKELTLAQISFQLTLDFAQRLIEYHHII